MSGSTRPPNAKETLVFGGGGPLLPATLDLPTNAGANGQTPAVPAGAITLDLATRPGTNGQTPMALPPGAVTLDLPTHASTNGRTPVVPVSGSVTIDLPPARLSDRETITYVPGAEGPGMGTTAPFQPRVGRFVLRKKLGEGAFGEVYQAYDPQLDRDVALKLAKPGTLGTAERRERFFREAKAAGNLRHPNIVPLFEAGQQDDRCYIASAYIAGKTLEAVIEGHAAGGTPMPAADAARVTRLLAAAMAYAHSQGVVHRDVKPQNVMVDEAGEPLLLDFGLAARAAAGDEKLTQEGTAMGTPAYMAPEQIDGNGIAASDQYSLGCALYQMLTGRTPFAGGIAQQMYLHQHEPVSPPRRLRRNIPRDLETICLKALEKDPAKRYPGCADLAEDLRRFLAAEPILARSVGLLERGIKWARRRPALAGTVFLTVCLGCLGAGIYGLYAEQRTRVLRQQGERRRQADDLWVRGREAEADGRQALARDDSPAATRHLAEAAGAMEQAVAVLAASRDPGDETLRAEVESRLLDVRRQAGDLATDQGARHRVQAAVAQLGRDRDELLFRHLSVDAAGRAGDRLAITKLAPAALAAFHIDTAGAGDKPLSAVARYFQSDAQRRQTARWCCEALFVWAEAEEGKTAVRALTAAEAVAAAHQVPVPNALYARRAALAAALGDADAAKADLALAARPPASALDHFLTAVADYRNDKFAAAVRRCEEAVRLEPGYFWPPYLQGLCHLRQQQWALADAWLTTCVTQRPDAVWPRVLRAQARVEMRNVEGATADLSAAGDAAEPAARYLMHMTRGRLASIREQWADARDAFAAAAAIGPAGGYQADLNLAEIYRRLGDDPAALGALDRVIAAQPADGQLYYTRAQFHRKANADALARRDYEKAIEAGGRLGDRWLASAHVELGYLKHTAKDLAGALAEYDAALMVVDDFVPAHRQRAETLLALGKHAEAGRALDKCLAKAPDAELYRARGLIHAARREYSPAALAYSQSLKLKDDPQVLNYRGWAYLQAQSLPLARADFDAALTAKPDLADALCGRAQILSLEGKGAEAVATAEKSLRHADKPTSTLLCNLASVYARAARLGPAAGDVATALLYQEHAAELLMRAAGLVPPDGRAAFWRDQVEKDATLRELLKHADVARVARSHGW